MYRILNSLPTVIPAVENAVWAQLRMRDMVQAYGKSLPSALIFISTNVMAERKVGGGFGKERGESLKSFYENWREIE